MNWQMIEKRNWKWYPLEKILNRKHNKTIEGHCAIAHIISYQFLIPIEEDVSDFYFYLLPKENMGNKQK